MLALRVLTAAFLGLCFVVLLFVAPRVLWLSACALIMAVACREWGRLAGLSAPANAAFTAALMVAVAGIALAPQMRAYAGTVYGIATLFWIIAAPVFILKRSDFGRGLVVAAGAIVLVPAFAALIDLRDASAARTLAVAAVVWVSDTAAYLAGRQFGRHKLAPGVSPGKTWEGVWGALAGVALYSAAWSRFPAAALPPPPLAETPMLIAIALALAVLGIAGDLFESRLKRNAGVKDSGTLLPGHGGLLDRIDALLPVLPAAAWLFT